jgi:F-type H+-transporting ATPase subunit epsilon
MTDSDLFTVEITTPHKKWAFENVKSCSAPGVKGSFQVLHNHAPLLNQLEIGAIKLETAEETFFYAASGGFLEVLNNKVVLLLETCEKAEQIDVSRAENAADRARTRLSDKTEEVDLSRAKLALARALNRIRIAGKSM